MISLIIIQKMKIITIEFELFFKYYINCPFGGMWSHYDTKGAKPNNIVEAYNLALKKFVNHKTNLNIYESIELFQTSCC
jgi:hypothetical protein